MIDDPKEASNRILEIKHLPATDQAGVIMQATQTLLGKGPIIREKIQSLGGPLVQITVRGQDDEIVKAALLALLAHDIATLPDHQLRAKALQRHDEVARILKIDPSDALFFRDHLRFIGPVLRD